MKMTKKNRKRVLAAEVANFQVSLVLSPWQDGLESCPEAKDFGPRVDGP
jgi:hypothetical protein